MNYRFSFQAVSVTRMYNIWWQIVPDFPGRYLQFGNSYPSVQKNVFGTCCVVTGFHQLPHYDNNLTLYNYT